MTAAAKREKITDSIKRFIEDYNREIDEAVEQVREGKFKTHEEAEAILKTWESK